MRHFHSGIVIIEAKEGSGSLTTANWGFKLNRNVFVLPGGAKMLEYRGSNQLLVKGGKCILGYEDIIKYYPKLEIKLSRENKKEIQKENIPEEYKEIYNELLSGMKNIEELEIKLNKEVSILNSKLTLMELKRLYKENARKFL